MAKQRSIRSTLMPSSAIPLRPLLARTIRRVELHLEKHFKLCAALLVLLMLACSVVLDLRRKMWIDELFTLFMAHQPSLSQIVKATLEGCDGGTPPLYAMIVHTILPLVQNDALAVRLPSSLGFCGAAIFLLAFCRRRLPPIYSFVAVLLMSTTCLRYATEGRCYGLMLCCGSAALLCWQSAADSKRRALAVPLLAFCMASMTALHYYSIFFLVPLLLAEAMRWWKSGKLDLPVLAAMAVVLPVLGLHYPFFAVARQFQAHFWARASWIDLIYLLTYVAMLAPLALLRMFPARPVHRAASETGLTLPEWIAAGAFLVMPLFILILSIYITHMFVLRYTLWAAIGIAVLVAALLYRASRGNTTVAFVDLVLLLALLSWNEASSLLEPPLLLEGQAILDQLNSAPGSQPIVIADAHVFMELSYYAPHPLRDRLIYPLDRELDLRYFGIDTEPLLLSALSHRSNLPIVPYDAVLAAHPRFVLASVKRDYLQDYLPAHLVDAGYTVTPIASSASSLLYEVQAPSPQIHQP